MDGILSLKHRHDLQPDQIDALHIRAPVSHLNNLMYDDPRDELQAKFSLEYGVAVALLTGNCTLGDFTAGAAMREEVRALYPRIHRHPVDRSEGEFPTEVEVVLKDGRRLQTAVAMPAGSLAAPFTLDQHLAKLDGCTAGLLSLEQSKALRKALADLPQLPNINALTAPLAGPFPF